LLNELTNPEIITVESLFVDEVQPRLPAVDETTGNILNGAFFEFATVTQTQLGAPAVSITFNDAGKGIFCRITGRNIGQQLAIFVGGELKTSPVINEEICGGQTQISGQFTREETQTLARDLNEGALPAPLILSQEEKVSPVLGDRSLQQIILAGGVGILAIVIYMMLIYGYRQAIITAIGLVSFLIFVFALLKLIGAVLGLSGLAAIILTIGMSVDAMILMFERIDENISTGSSKRDAIRDGANQAWSAVRDGNASTGLIGIILLFMGVGMFKGFGTMMVITIIFIVLVVYPMTKVLATLLITDD
jgi:protein-export membrane protein SecD